MHAKKILKNWKTPVTYFLLSKVMGLTPSYYDYYFQELSSALLNFPRNNRKRNL